jgi:membrane associated rhomboid family serine protease
MKNYYNYKRDWIYRNRLNKYDRYYNSTFYTYLLMFILIISFLIQVFILAENQNIMEILMLNSNHLFTGNYISILTSLFLHGDIFHLLSNLLAVFIFGRIVERQFSFGMLLIFLGGGVFANILSSVFSYFMGNIFFSLGASSGIASLIIFAILLDPFKSPGFYIPIPIFIIGWFLIYLDIIRIFNPSNVNHLAHLSGYLSLLFLFYFLELRHRRRIKNGFLINLLLLGIAFIIGIYLL